MEPRYNEGSRGLAKCVRGHNEVSVYRDFFHRFHYYWIEEYRSLPTEDFIKYFREIVVALY